MSELKYIELIKAYSKESYQKLKREPAGQLRYPFIVPGSVYANELWDWDSWLTNIAIRQIMKDHQDEDPEFFEYEKGCILNFLSLTTDSGWMPIMIKPAETIPKTPDAVTSIHKPCLAQHALFVIRENQGNVEWLKPYMDKFDHFFAYQKRNMFHQATGLYFWPDDTAIGVDNDPCTFYRPDGSSASIYLNCMMYQELLAMAEILKLLGRDAKYYENEAESLKQAVQEHLWDERNGFYYSADLNLKPIDKTQWLHSGMPRHWDCLIQRIDCWSGFMAMWAGIATKEQAQRMVRENMEKPELFGGKYGIRTLAKTEKMYRIIPSGNPSCWLGPVWGIPNYMCFQGLLDYGFTKEAKELAERTIELFGKDLEACGELHEYYDPDTGEGVNNQGFQSWNLLVNCMIAEISE